MTNPTDPEVPAQTQTIRGNCHCAAVKYSVEVPTPLKEVDRCNCSHCAKLNTRWYPYRLENFKFEKGEDSLTEYRYGAKQSVLKFCKMCGCTLSFDGMGETMIIARTFRDLDIDNFKVKLFDGASRPPAYIPPKYAGPELIPGESEKLYTGGCHCGNITVALMSKPLPEVEVRECDCSICTQHGYTFAYPNKDNVGVNVKDDSQLKIYQFGRKFLEHVFCGTCGVPVFIRVLGPPVEVIAKMPDHAKAHAAEMVKIMPVNLHILDGVEWDTLNVTKTQGKDQPPKYVVED